MLVTEHDHSTGRTLAQGTTVSRPFEWALGESLPSAEWSDHQLARLLGPPGGRTLSARGDSVVLRRSTQPSGKRSTVKPRCMRESRIYDTKTQRDRSRRPRSVPVPRLGCPQNAQNRIVVASVGQTIGSETWFTSEAPGPISDRRTIRQRSCASAQIFAGLEIWWSGFSTRSNTAGVWGLASTNMTTSGN